MSNTKEFVLRLLAVQLYRVIDELEDLWSPPLKFRLSYLERVLHLHRRLLSIVGAFYTRGIQCTPLLSESCYATKLSKLLQATEEHLISLVLDGNEISPRLDVLLQLASNEHSEI
jgi:hypothetical protein